jgi:hypothetical protein
VAVPRHRHENIGAGQQYDGQPAGLSQIIHPAKIIRRDELSNGKKYPTQKSNW